MTRSFRGHDFLPRGAKGQGRRQVASRVSHLVEEAEKLRRVTISIVFDSRCWSRGGRGGGEKRRIQDGGGRHRQRGRRDQS